MKKRQGFLIRFDRAKIKNTFIYTIAEQPPIYSNTYACYFNYSHMSMCVCI